MKTRGFIITRLGVRPAPPAAEPIDLIASKGEARRLWPIALRRSQFAGIPIHIAAREIDRARIQRGRN